MLYYKFINPQDVFEDDSSLSLGYFIINNREVLKDSLCIVIIALTELIEGVQFLSEKKSGSFLWVPTDSGEKLLFRTTNKTLMCKYGNFELVFNTQAFLDSLKEQASQLIFELSSARKAVIKEAAFIDLLNCLTR